MRKTSAYELMQKSATIPVCGSISALKAMGNNSTGQAYVSPAIVGFVDVHCAKIVGTRAISAILARGLATRIDEVPSLARDEVLHIVPACCVLGDVDASQLIRFALNIHIPHDWLKQRTDQVGEGIKIVHPVPPERLDLGIRHNDSAEVDEASTEDERVGKGGGVFVGAIRGDGLGN